MNGADSVEIEDYVSRLSEPEPELLYRLWRATNVETVHGHMASGHLQGRLLKMFVLMIRPRHILEVGTFSGYSALCMAEGLAQLAAEAPEEMADSHLWTYEKNDEMEDFARRWIASSPHAGRITLTIGDALIEAPALGVGFDMIFLDGDKRTYTEAYEVLLPTVRPGGFIIADNTLWDSHVVDPQYDRDSQTRGIRHFNEHIAADPRCRQIILPLRDGLTLIRKNFNHQEQPTSD